MNEFLVLAMALGSMWLLLSLPLVVFIGKCISVGQAGETERHCADERRSSAEVSRAVVPAQRRPVAPARSASAVH